MISFDTFYKIMSSFSGSNALPAITVNPASSLGIAMQKLALPIQTVPSSDNVVKDTLQCLVSNCNNPLCERDFGCIEKIGQSYATGVLNSFNYLRFIKDSVNQIKDKITTSMNAEAASSEVITKANMASSDNYKSEFVMIPWDDIYKLGTSGYVVEQLKSQLGIFEETSPKDISMDSSTVAILYNKCRDFYLEHPATSVPMSSEQIDQIVELCHDKANITRENISRYLGCLLSAKTMTTWVANAFQSIREASIADTIEVISNLRNMNAIVSVLDNKDLFEKTNLTERQVKGLGVNLNLAAILMNFEYVFVQAQRNRFKNVLVCSTNLLNPDGVAEFRKQGFDLIDVSKFIYGRNVTQVPDTGYEVGSVVLAINNVREELDRNKESLERLANIELNKIKKSTFIRHVSSFMDELVDKTSEPKIGNMQRYIEHMAEDVIYLDGDIDAALYGVIINANFPGTFVQTLYENLGKAYVGVLSNIQKPDEATMSESEVSTIVSLIVDHVFNVLVDEAK